MTLFDHPLINRLIEALSWTILHSFWQISVVVLVSSILLILFRKNSSRLRYGITFLSFCFIIGWSGLTFIEYFTTTDLLGELSSTDNFEEIFISANNTIEQQNLFSSLNGKIVELASELLSFTPDANIVVICWLLGVVFLALKLAGGFLFLNFKTRKGRVKADISLIDLVNRMINKMHIKQTVRVFYSLNITVPSVVGVLKPVILFPIGMLSGIPVNQVEAIIAHELAHIKRLDVLVNIFQSVVEVIFFFHPGVWWLSKAMRIERENCSDDLALKVSDEPITYIKALSNIEEFRLTKSNIMVALSNNKEHLLSRIKRMITGKNQTLTSPTYILAIALMLIGILSFKPAEHISPEVGSTIEYLNDYIGLSSSMQSENMEFEPEYQATESFIFVRDTTKKKSPSKKSEKELHRALEEKEEMEHDKDFDHNAEIDFDHDELMKEVQDALIDVQENLKDIHFDFDFDKTMDKLSDFEFHIDDFEFPDSIEMRRIREELKRSAEEFKDFSQEDLQIDIDQIRMEMKVAMEKLKEEMDEFKENDWKKMKEEIHKSIEDWKKSEEYRKLDTNKVISYDLENFKNNAFEANQKAMLVMQSRIKIQETYKFDLQQRQKLIEKIKLQHMKEFQKQISELEDQKVLL